MPTRWNMQVTPGSNEYVQVRRFTRSAGISPATQWRWWKKGVRGGVKLRTVCIGGRRYTTEEWWNEFITACSQGDAPTAENLATTAARRRAHEQAERELDAAGLN